MSSSEVCVRVNLQPSQQLKLVLEPAKPGSDPGSFSIAQEPSSFVIANGRIGVRVPGKGAFVAGEAPEPILALRRGNEWVGQGTWGKAMQAGRVETTLLDRGPLFARWSTRCVLGERELASYELVFHDGEDFVRVRDRSRTGKGLAFRFRFAGAIEWFTYGGGEAVNVLRRPLSERPDQKGQNRKDEFVHIDFSSGHFQMSYTWAGFILPGQTALGVTELNGGHWKIPGRNRIRVCRQGNDLEFVFPSHGGSKECG